MDEIQLILAFKKLAFDFQLSIRLSQAEIVEESCLTHFG